MKRHLQAKRAKYWKFHIIETTASHTPVLRPFFQDFNQILHNDRDHHAVSRWVAQYVPNKSNKADGRHFEKKTLNPHISASVWQILMKSGLVTHAGPLQRTDC